MFGNTEQVARAVAGGLATGGIDAVVVDVAAAPVDLPADLDLLVLGAPTHAFSLSRPSTRADAVRQGAPPERAARGLREWLSAVLRWTRGTARSRQSSTPASRRYAGLPTAAGPRAVRLARRRGLDGARPTRGVPRRRRPRPLVDGELERARLAAGGTPLGGLDAGQRRPISPPAPSR